jgi:hypothetical protein
MFSELVGDAWIKLGFELNGATSLTHIGSRSYDFS